jgi:uncharacterized membrane protein YdbT with pleckstrin-like domain
MVPRRAFVRSCYRIAVVTLDEQELWHGKPSLKVLALDAAWVAGFTLILALVVGFAFTPAVTAISKLSPGTADAVTDNLPGLRLAAIVFVVVVAGSRIVRLAWRGLVLRSHSYRLTNQRLLVESGVFSRTIDEIDLRTVDDITFHQRFFERVLGLGQIGIVSSEPDTSGQAPRRAGVRAKLLGIANPRDVREQVRNAAYAATGKQVFMRPT